MCISVHIFVYICLYTSITLSLQFFFLPFHFITLLSPPVLRRSHQQHSNPPNQIFGCVSIGDDRGTALSCQIFIFPSYLSIIPQYCVLFLGVSFLPDPVCDLNMLFTELLLHFCSTLTGLIFLFLKYNIFFSLTVKQCFLFCVYLLHIVSCVGLYVAFLCLCKILSTFLC